MHLNPLWTSWCHGVDSMNTSTKVKKKKDILCYFPTILIKKSFNNCSTCGGFQPWWPESLPPEEFGKTERGGKQSRPKGGQRYSSHERDKGNVEEAAHSTHCGDGLHSGPRWLCQVRTHFQIVWTQCIAIFALAGQYPLYRYVVLANWQR